MSILPTVPTPMVNRFRLLIVLASIGVAPHVAWSQKNTCPTEASALRQMAVHFSRSADYASTRQQYQLPTLDSAQVRLLTQQQGDGTVCSKLITLLQQTAGGVLATSNFRVAFYQAGTRYYVAALRADAVNPPPAGTIRLGMHGLLWVVESSTKPKLVGKVTM